MIASTCAEHYQKGFFLKYNFNLRIGIKLLLATFPACNLCFTGTSSEVPVSRGIMIDITDCLASRCDNRDSKWSLVSLLIPSIQFGIECLHLFPKLKFNGKEPNSPGPAAADPLHAAYAAGGPGGQAECQYCGIICGEPLPLGPPRPSRNGIQVAKFKLPPDESPCTPCQVVLMKHPERPPGRDSKPACNLRAAGGGAGRGWGRRGRGTGGPGPDDTGRLRLGLCLG